jgi:prevent-host-death family protein
MTLGEAEAHFADVVARVRAGEEIVIAEDGEPVIRLSPVAGKRTRKRQVGCDVGKGWIADDFDDLPDDFDVQVDATP